MPKAIKYVEKAAALTANAAWQVFDRLNQINQAPSFTPKWSDKPLLKSCRRPSRRSAGRAPRTRFAHAASPTFASRS